MKTCGNCGYNNKGVCTSSHPLFSNKEVSSDQEYCANHREIKITIQEKKSCATCRYKARKTDYRFGRNKSDYFCLSISNGPRAGLDLPVENPEDYVCNHWQFIK